MSTVRAPTLTMVRPRGLEPPRVSPLAPQASASTNSAMAASRHQRALSCRLTSPSLPGRQGATAAPRPQAGGSCMPGTLERAAGLI